MKLPASSAQRLYLITPPDADATTFPRLFEQVCVSGAVGLLQVRTKEAAGSARTLRLLRACLDIARHFGVAVLANDCVDDALATAADGVHIGQTDDNLAHARRRLTSRAIIGVTCHDSVPLAMAAVKGGADYVAFGSIFPSTTKPTAKAASLDVLRRYQREGNSVACVAIGGITPQNAAATLAAGADYLAVCSALWQHRDGCAAAAEQLRAAIHDFQSGNSRQK